MGGVNSNSSNDEIFELAYEDSKKYFNYTLNKDLIKDEAEIIKERKGELKYNLTIRIYSDKKLSDKYQNYLNSIKMNDWEIIFLDGRFCEEKTKELIKKYKTKSINKKIFDEVLVILIDSFESFINMSKIERTNFLKNCNNELTPEEQPFFFFINKNEKDFEYITSEFIFFKDIDCKEFERECINFINSFKDEYNIEIIYKIKYDIYDTIIPLLKSKKNHKDNFNIIFENGKEFIYSNKFIEEDEQQNIHDLIEKEKYLIIKNLDYKIHFESDFEFLWKLVSQQANVVFYFETHKPKFNKAFENFLSQYESLDKRNFHVQNYYFSPLKNFRKFCGYYHEYGNVIDKFVKYPSKINIGICGRAGAGKSTLLNIILGEKKCLEGQGRSISNFMASYSHPKYPLNFIDFPGFGDKNHAENLIKQIKEKNCQLNNFIDKIHLIIYCVKFGERTFLDKEDNVVYELMNLNIKIIFVFTKGEKEDSSQFSRFKYNFLTDLTNILKRKNIIINENDINIISIYSMQEEKHGYTIKPFGLDKLFKSIYEYFKEYIIEDWALEEIKNTEDDKILTEIIDLTSITKIYLPKNELIKVIKNKISGKIKLNSYLYLLAKGLNDGIEGIKKISEDFKKLYEK